MPIVQVSKKVITLCSDGYLEFGLKNVHRGVKIYSAGPAFFFFFFFLIRFRLMAVRVIFDIGRVVDKCPVYPMKGR